jgi:hypothetical protein
VGQVEVYKVHHHCSQYSTNDAWLAITKPILGIVSVGDANGYGHPTQECLERLHAAGVKTYWTETGEAAKPEPGQDVVAGNIVVEVAPGAESFTVARRGATADTYAVWGALAPVTQQQIPTFSWSKNSSVYHYSTCRYVENISPENLVQANTPPQGKTLHQGCPR